MRTYPGLKLSLFDPEQREQLKIIDDMLRQVSGGLARSIQTGQSPAANPVPSLSNPTGSPPLSGSTSPNLGDLLYGFSGAWARLSIGPTDYFLVVVNGVPAWVSSSTIKTRQQFEWHANGPYIIDTAVDGAIAVPTAMTLSAVWLTRSSAGAAGSTTVDLNLNGTTMYTTQANRPTIAFNDADNKVQATLPDVVIITAGDVLTLDIDAVETGSPAGLTLTIEGA